MATEIVSVKANNFTLQNALPDPCFVTFKPVLINNYHNVQVSRVIDGPEVNIPLFAIVFVKCR